MVIEISYRVNNGEKMFGITVAEAVEQFVAEQKQRVGRTDNGIIKGRYETISTHLRHFVGYIGGKLKVNEVTKSLLQKYEIDGIQTDYVSFRKESNVSDSTIRNELSTIGMCFGWLIENGYTNIHKLHLPYTNANKYDIDRNLIRRQTFKAEEYTAFYKAFKSYVAVKRNNLSDIELLDRQIVRDYLLICTKCFTSTHYLQQWKTWFNISHRLY